MVKRFYSFALLCVLTVVGALSANAQITITADPADGSTVEKLSSVTVNFAGAGAIDFGSAANNVTITSDKGHNAGCTLSYGDTDEDMVISFTEVTEQATYTINCPANAFNADKGTVPAFTLTYTVKTAPSGAVTLTPAAGNVPYLFDLVYNNSEVTGSVNADTYNGGKPTCTTPSGDVVGIQCIYDWQIGDGKYRMQLNKLCVEPGVYTVNIPDDLFYQYDANYQKVSLPGGEFTYTVEGATLTNVKSTPSMETPITMFNAMRIEFPGYTAITKNSTSTVYLWKEGEATAKKSWSMDYNMSVDGNALTYTDNYNQLIEPGHYYITFPEACVLLGEEQTPCTPFVVEFDIVEPEDVNIVLTPGDGDNVTMLNHVLINFPDADEVTLNSSSSVNLYLVDGENERSIANAYGSASILKIDDKTYDARLNGLATKAGQYKIVLTKNSFAVGTGFNQEVVAYVNFTEPELPAMTITPAAGSTLDKIQKFIVTFPDEAVVKVNEKLGNKTTTLYAGSELIDNGWGGYTNQQKGNTSTYTLVEGTTNSFEFTLSDAAIEAGDYLLSIPAGIFLMGDDEHSYNAAAQYVYTATGNGMDKIVAYPSAPVKSLKQVSVEYVDETSIMLQTEYTSFSWYKVNTEQSWDDYKEYISANSGAVTVDGNKLNITLSEEYTEEGTYYIEITKWSLYLSDGVTTPTPQKVYWTVDPNAVETAIQNVENNAAQRIYTVNGVEVQSMNKSGIYVVNGKKVMVK